MESIVDQVAGAQGELRTDFLDRACLTQGALNHSLVCYVHFVASLIGIVRRIVDSLPLDHGPKVGLTPSKVRNLPHNLLWLRLGNQTSLVVEGTARRKRSSALASPCFSEVAPQLVRGGALILHGNVSPSIG